MKKLLPLLLILLLTVSLCACGKAAPEVQEPAVPEVTPEPTPEPSSPEDFEFSLLDDGTASVTKYKGSDSEIIIPASLDGHAVTAIGDDAFSGGTMTSVTIPEGVTVIGNQAFRECTDLIEAVIPGTVKSIGAAAFARCGELKECTIPQGITRIETATFADCAKITGFTIPGGVTCIGDSAFASCAALEKVNIPEGVTEIGAFAFAGTGLKEAVIPEGVTFIGEAAFSWCPGLHSVTLPSSIPGFDFNVSFKDSTEGIKFTVPGGSDMEKLCGKQRVTYSSVSGTN